MAPSWCSFRLALVSAQGMGNVGSVPSLNSLYRSLKTWKIMEFKNFVFQAWKVMQFTCCTVLVGHEKLWKIIVKSGIPIAALVKTRTK